MRELWLVFMAVACGYRSAWLWQRPRWSGLALEAALVLWWGVHYTRTLRR